jgi:hypothetical protein
MKFIKVWVYYTTQNISLLLQMHVCVRKFLTLLTGSTAQRFMATGAPLAAKRIRILPMPDA